MSRDCRPALALVRYIKIISNVLLFLFKYLHNVKRYLIKKIDKKDKILLTIF